MHWIVRILMVIIFIIILIPVLVYLPPVQNLAKDIALKEVKKSTGMDISIDYLRIRFPLKVEVDGVSIVEANAADTMLIASRAAVDVKVMPLLKLEVEASGIEADEVRYQMGTPDSIMYLTANVHHAEINQGDIELKQGRIFADMADVEGAKIHLVLKPDSTVTPKDTTESTPWRIQVRKVTLRDIDYTMQMYPTIDSLHAYVGEATLNQGLVDMASKQITARYLGVDSVTATYLYPTPQFLKAHPELTITSPPDTTAANEAPWTIRADSLRLTAKSALYAMTGARPAAGIDMNYLQVSDVLIAIDDFYNRGTSITLPIKALQATERCGLRLEADGTFAMDSTRMWADDLTIATNNSRLNLQSASMGMGDVMTDPNLPLSLRATARISPKDLMLALPSMQKTLRPLADRGSATLVADIYGTPRRLNIDRLDLNAMGLLRLEADGTVMNLLDFDRLAGKVNLDGEISNGSTLAQLLPVGTLPKGVLIPSLTLAGSIDYSPGKIAGNIHGATEGGTIAVDGHWIQRSESYDADLALKNFPVDAFVPEYEVGRVTATLRAKGHGYNPLSPKTAMDIDLDVASVEYQHTPIGAVVLQAHVSGGEASGHLDSSYPDADLTVDFDALVKPNEYAWNVEGDVRNLDLNALHLTTDTIWGHVGIFSEGVYYPHSGNIDATLNMQELVLGLSDLVYMIPSVDVDVATTDSTINASAHNGDFHLRLATKCGIKNLMARVDRFPALIDTMIQHRSLNVEALQAALPVMELDLSMGTDNAVTSLLHRMDFDINNLYLNLKNDSLISLTGHAYDMNVGTTSLDSINLSIYQRAKTLAYDVHLDNRPGTLDDFAHVKLNGFVADSTLTAYIDQHNIKGEQGFNLGLLAQMRDSMVTARIVPTTPIIAYREWQLNPDNYVAYNLQKGWLRGDLSLTDGSSALRVYTPGSIEDGRPKDVLAKLSNVQIADWLSMVPDAPPMSGVVNADLNITSAHKMILGDGTLSLKDFTYEKKRVGDFDAGLKLTTDPTTGFLRADMDLMVDSVKTMTVSGLLNDSTATSPVMLDLSMFHFPLKTINPFIPDKMASLEGTLNGSMKITGKTDKPMFDGFIAFDSAAVKVKMLGSTLRFSNDSVPVHNNVVRFNEYPIYAVNKNPLTLNGTVDINNISNIAMDLVAKARNIQVVNSERARGADVYGKGFLDIDASVAGDMRFLKVNAAVDLLAGSNVTYVLSSENASAITSAGEQDMVHFVQFNDSAAVARADSLHGQGMAMMLNAVIKVSEGSTINVDLPSIGMKTEGKNRVTINGNGELTYTSSPVNVGRMVGRFNINSGFVRYTPPVLSEKMFTFQEGSYVAFNGPLLDPILNLHATDVVKANVTRAGENSRLVNFNVGVSVTNSLENMNVAFDLSTNDDITVQNELASMSPEQRANQAMNMLLYGVYQGAGTTGNANIGGNLLYSFVESTINSWMANTIKGVDISVGIDQYDKTYEGSTSTATNYSYQVSKSLFNDRFKIVVGGSYSTDNDGSEENVADALFNDISAEYMLNKNGTMYIKVFRHAGYESILEGEIIQTGVGFVYKKRISSLLDMFRK